MKSSDLPIMSASGMSAGGPVCVWAGGLATAAKATALLLVLLGSIAGRAVGQESGSSKPPPTPPPLPPASGTAADPRISSLAPGVLPEGTSAEARLVWERVCQGNLSSAAPVTAFVLDLDVRYRGGPSRSNDVKAVYSFLAPACVRVAVEGKRDALRGPAGDWLVDRARKEKVELTTNREFAEDRRQLDETLSIAKTFLALTDPRSLRIAALTKLAAAPASVPESLKKRAGELAWLSVSSPDFRLVGSGASASLFRAALGSDPATGFVEMALVEEDVPGALRPTARLVQLVTPKSTQGFLVPQQILVHAPEGGPKPSAFVVPAGMDLWIKKADLRAQLTAENFRP